MRTTLKIRPLLLVILTLALSLPAYGYQSLQEVFDNAGPNGDYQKYMELDPGVEYLGDLYISDQMMVYLNGNGALIHGGDEMSIFVSGADMTLFNCVIVGGKIGIQFWSNASGIIFSNTISRTDSIGIDVSFPNLDKGVEVYDNIITDTDYGFTCVEEYRPVYLDFNTVYNTDVMRYAEWCPD
jgi:hypothetical protein